MFRKTLAIAMPATVVAGAVAAVQVAPAGRIEGRD